LKAASGINQGCNCRRFEKEFKAEVRELDGFRIAIETMNKRIDSLERRMDSMEQRISRVEANSELLTPSFQF
jgi:prefoldin subunit 5